jgi:hypothetical protein
MTISVGGLVLAGRGDDGRDRVRADQQLVLLVEIRR